MRLTYRKGRRIVIRDYENLKDRIDDFCRRYGVGYEIRRDGSAVIFCD